MEDSMEKHLVCCIALLTLSGSALAADAPATPPDFAAQFSEGDTNRDGKLTYDEYQAARMTRDGGKADEAKIKHYVERFAALDVNRDKVLSLEEYRGRIANEKYQPGSNATPATPRPAR
jgi:hypothetical protein